MSDSHRSELFRIAVVVACLGTSVSTQVVTPRWIPMGPDAGTVFSLARNPFDPRMLLAGTYFGGLYQSEDSGLHWSYVPSALASLPVFALAFDPMHAGVVYASTFARGVFRSEDNGRTWSSRNAGLENHVIRSLAVDPVNPGVVLAATEGGVFRTTNSGDAWSPVTTSPANVVMHEPLRPGIVYAGTPSEGILRSTDGGLTWISDNRNLAAASIVALTWDGRDGGTVFAAGDGRAYQRAWPDQAWEDLSSGLPFGRVSEVAAEPGGERLFAVTDSGIFWASRRAPRMWAKWAEFSSAPRSILFDAATPLISVLLYHGGVLMTANDGDSWVNAADGMQNLFVGALATTAPSGQTIRYAGTDLGVYIGSSAFDTNMRTNWYQNRSFREGIFKLVPHPTASGVVFAGTERVGVWKSSDFGVTWDPLSDGLVPLQIYDIAQSRLDTDTMYVAASSGLYRSRDRGRSWTAAAAREFNPTYIFTVATDPTRPGTTYFGSVDGLVLKTLDGGEHFFLASKGLPRDSLVALRISSAGGVYAVTGNGSLYASMDGGANWFPAQTGLTDAVHTLETEGANTLYAGTFGSGVFKSDSAGASWHPTGVLPFPTVFSLAVDPRTAGTIFAGTLSVFKSSDGGTNWTPAGAGLPFGAVTDIAIDAADSRLIYASIQDQGVFQSRDSGATWAPAGINLPPSGRVPIRTDVSTSRRAYAGTYLGGFFVSEAGDGIWASSSHGMSVFVRGLAISAQQPDTMYAGALLGGMFKTIDGGVSWRNIGLNNNQILDVAVNPQFSDVVYAATTQGVKLSLTGGNQWTSLGPQNGFGYGVFILAIVIHPSYPNLIYAGSSGEGVFRSANWGLEWTPVNFRLDNREILALLIDPRRTDTLYAATGGGGVYVTDNGGFSWSPLGEGLFTGVVTSLALDPLIPDVVYAGTEGGGVFRLSR